MSHGPPKVHWSSKPFLLLVGTASCLALPTHWFLGHLLSQSLWLPVWACAAGLWKGICRRDLEEGLCQRERREAGKPYSVFHFASGPQRPSQRESCYICVQIASKSSAVSCPNCHSSASRRCRLESTFPECHIDAIIHSVFFCAWLFLSRSLTCTGIARYNTSILFIAV